jgi:hypothetical protein
VSSRATPAGNRSARGRGGAGSPGPAVLLAGSWRADRGRFRRCASATPVRPAPQILHCPDEAGTRASLRQTCRGQLVRTLGASRRSPPAIPRPRWSRRTARPDPSPGPAARHGAEGRAERAGPSSSPGRTAGPARSPGAGRRRVRSPSSQSTGPGGPRRTRRTRSRRRSVWSRSCRPDRAGPPRAAAATAADLPARRSRARSRRTGRRLRPGRPETARRGRRSTDRRGRRADASADGAVLCRRSRGVCDRPVRGRPSSRDSATMGSGVVFAGLGWAAAGGAAGRAVRPAVLPGASRLRLVGSGRRGQVAIRAVRSGGGDRPGGGPGPDTGAAGPAVVTDQRCGVRRRPSLCPEPARPPPAPRPSPASGSSLRSSCRPASGVGAGCGPAVDGWAVPSTEPAPRRARPRPVVRCRGVVGVVGALDRVRIGRVRAGVNTALHGASGTSLAAGATGGPLVAPVRRAKASARARCSSARCPADRAAVRVVSGVARVGPPAGVRPGGPVSASTRSSVPAGPAAAVIGTASVGAAAWSTSASPVRRHVVRAGGHVVRVVVPVGRSAPLAVAAGRCSPASGASVRVGLGLGTAGGRVLTGGPARRLPRLRGETAVQRRAGCAGGQAVEAGRPVDRPAVGGRECGPRHGPVRQARALRRNAVRGGQDTELGGGPSGLGGARRRTRLRPRH